MEQSPEKSQTKAAQKSPQKSAQNSSQSSLQSSSPMETTQKLGQIIENPIKLPLDAAKRVAEELDAHLSSMMALFHQYYKHHWLVKGPQFRDLHHFFEEKYKEVQEDFDEVAERITMLGGIPTSGPSNMVQKSLIAPEQEGDHPIRSMISKDLDDEGRLIVKLRETIDLALSHKDYGTEHMLKKMLYNGEMRAHELEHFLEDDSLERRSGLKH